MTAVTAVVREVILPTAGPSGTFSFSSPVPKLTLKLKGSGGSLGSHRLAQSDGGASPLSARGTLTWGDAAAAEADGMAGAASFLRIRPDNSTTPPHSAGPQAALTGGWDSSPMASPRLPPVVPASPRLQPVPPGFRRVSTSASEPTSALSSARRSLTDFGPDAAAPSTLSALRLLQQLDSPLPLLDNMVRANDALYSERNALATGGRALNDQAAFLSVALRATHHEISDMQAHMGEQELHTASLEAKRGALLAELLVLQRELEAAPPAALCYGSAAAVLEVITQRDGPSQRQARCNVSRGTTLSGTSEDSYPGMYAASASALTDAEASIAFGVFLQSPPRSPQRYKSTAPPSPRRVSTASSQLSAPAVPHLRLDTDPSYPGSLSSRGRSRSTLFDEGEDAEAAALEAARQHCQTSLDNLVFDARETKASLQKQLLDLTGVANKYRARMAVVQSTHEAALVRLKAITVTHVELQSTQLDMLTRDSATGTSLKTRAIIQSGARDAARQGRVAHRPGAATGPNTTPLTSPRAVNSAILRAPARVEHVHTQPDHSKLYTDPQREVAMLEVLSPVKRLMRLQELSSQFSRAGMLASHLHTIMTACEAANSLDNVSAALETLVTMGRTLLGADKLHLYRCQKGMAWCVSPLADRCAPRPVDRGVVAYVAQSAATIHTPALRKSHVYVHEAEDVQVPHIPHTPALAMAVRDASCPQYPVGGQLPGKLVLKAVGKTTRAVGGEPAGFSPRDVSMMKVLGSLFERLVDSWDSVSKIQMLNMRLEKLLVSTRAVLQSQDSREQLFDLAAVAVDVLHAEAAVIYVLDRHHGELVGYCSGPERQRIKRPLSGSLGQVFSGGDILNLVEVERLNDNTYSALHDAPPGVLVHTALLAPVELLGGGNKLLGLVQVVNKRHVEGSVLRPVEVQHLVFDGDDEKIIRGVAAAVTSAVTACGSMNALMDRQAGADPIFACRNVHDAWRKVAAALKETLQCESVRVFLPKPEIQQLHMPLSFEDLHYPVKGMAGRAASSGRVQCLRSSRPEDMQTRQGTPQAGAPGTPRGAATAKDVKPVSTPRGRKVQYHHNDFTGEMEEAILYQAPESIDAAASIANLGEREWDLVDEQVYDAFVDAGGNSPVCALAVPLLMPGSNQVWAVVGAVNKRHGSFQGVDAVTIRAAAGRASIVLLSAAALEAIEAQDTNSEELGAYLTKLSLEAKDFRRLGALVEDMVQNMTHSDMCVLAFKPGVDAPPGYDVFQRAQTMPLIRGRAASMMRTGFEGGDGLVCPAGVMSDGHNHPDVMERAAGVVRTGKVLDEVEGNPEDRDEYNGKTLPFSFRYYIPIFYENSDEILGALGIERAGYRAYGQQERHLMDVMAKRIAMLIRHNKLHQGQQGPNSPGSRRFTDAGPGSGYHQDLSLLEGLLEEDDEEGDEEDGPL